MPVSGVLLRNCMRQTRTYYILPSAPRPSASNISSLRLAPSKALSRVAAREKRMAEPSTSAGHASIPSHELYCLAAWQMLKGWQACERHLPRPATAQQPSAVAPLSAREPGLWIVHGHRHDEEYEVSASMLALSQTTWLLATSSVLIYCSDRGKQPSALLSRLRQYPMWRGLRMLLQVSRPHENAGYGCGGLRALWRSLAIARRLTRGQFT